MEVAVISILARSVLLLVIVHWTRGHRAGQEPVVYSRFDFESKLLERMVMVEHKMSLLEESTEKELDTLHKEKQTLEETVLRLKQQLEKEQANKIKQLDQLSKSLVTKVSAKLDDISTVLKDALTKLSLEGNATIQAFYDKTVKPAVAFHMKDPSDKSPGKNVVIKFASAVTNTNNVYDKGTGIFTAPTPGVYMFAVQICGFKNKYINFLLYVNNDAITDTTEYDNDSSFHCTSTSAVAVLEKGDTVCVKSGPKITSGATIYSQLNTWSTFSGILVH